MLLYGIICTGVGFILGVLCFIGYGVVRALGSDGWDDSNMLNWLRLLSFCYIHPERFGDMYYLSDIQKYWLTSAASPDNNLQRPFWYISEDEFEGVVKTR